MLTRSLPSIRALRVPSDRRENCTTLASVPDRVDILRLGLIGGGGLLRGHHQHAAGLSRLLQGADALVPLHEDRRQHPREEDEVAGRQ